MSFYKLVPSDKRGEPFEFSQLKGKVVLIVNVASKCGFTPQYKGLQALYDKYKDKGFVIIGFPCNQFRKQEPGTSEEIIQYCHINYGVTFPIMQKICVNGKDTDPVYRYLKSKKKGFFGLLGRVKWNFEKFLIDREGKVVGRYSSRVVPQSLEQEIQLLLG